MTQEEKELLLKDLCARLPYGVKCKIALYKTAFNIFGIVEDKVKLDSPVYDEGDDWWDITEIKPYLRPMSSMTKEEKKGYELLCDYYMDDKESKYYFNNIATIDWYHQKHFDCRGLIKLGLALEAPEGMYNIKEKQLWQIRNVSTTVL